MEKAAASGICTNLLLYGSQFCLRLLDDHASKLVLECDFYICIPNHDVGCKLSDYSDIFWNRERLSQHLKKDAGRLVAKIDAN